MFYALSWFVVVGLLVLWSLAAWAFHSIAAWSVANASVLAAGSGAVEALRIPDWLAPWVPAEVALAMSSILPALAPSIQTMIGWAPALAGGLSVGVWVIWGIGSVLLIMLGLVTSGLIAMLRRRSASHAIPIASRATTH